MGYIDFTAKTDRELLILVAQKCNETTDHLAKLNSTVAKHEQRINALEISPHCPTKGDWKSTIKDNWQTISLLGSIVALIALEAAKYIT